MNSRCMWTFWICLGFVSSSVAVAQEPEQAIELSPLQQTLDQTHKKYVIPDKDRRKRVRHYFRKKTLSFLPENVKEQITAYEMKDLEGYGDGPFSVYDATGKTGKDAAWEKWSQEIFTIEQDWASGLGVPFFCKVLRIRDDKGNRIDADDLGEKEYLDRSKRAIRAILNPLVEASGDPKKASELKQVPMYVVRYMGNFEGNSKFVKLYIGKPGTADFLVFDVSVFDHY